MKKAVILSGISGSGKSTLAKMLALRLNLNEDMIIASADRFFEIFSPWEADGTDQSVDQYRKNYDFKKLSQAHATAISFFMKAMLYGHAMVIADNTSTQRWESEPYIKAAYLAGYKPILVDFMATTVDHIKLCHARCTHEVPLNAIAAQAVRFQPHTDKEDWIIQVDVGCSAKKLEWIADTILKDDKP